MSAFAAVKWNNGSNPKSENQVIVSQSKIKTELQSTLPDCKKSFKYFLTGKTGQKPCFVDYTYPILTAYAGDRYIGETLDGTWHGKGNYYSKNGEIFKGTFANGHRVHGVYTWLGQYAGHKYVGYFKNNVFDGFGVYSFPDGSKNEGLFRNNKFSKKLTDLTDREFSSLEGAADYLCSVASYNGKWRRANSSFIPYIKEAKRRNLDCGVQEASTTTPSSKSVSSSELTVAQHKAERLRQKLAALTTDLYQEQQRVDSVLPSGNPEDQFRFALTLGLRNELETAEKAFVEFRELHPKHQRSSDALFWIGRMQFIQGQFEKSATTFSKFNALYSTDRRLPDTTLWIAESVSQFAFPAKACDIYDNLGKFLDQPPESFVMRLKELMNASGCSIQIANNASSAQITSATAPSSSSISSAELTAAQKEAESLRQELATLKTEQQQEQQRIDSDTQIPLITILSSSSNDRRGSIKGRATDNIAIAEVRVDGIVVPLKSDGGFEWEGFVPSDGLSVVIEAIDTAGLSSMQQVRLERGQLNQAAGPSFARLDPFRGKAAKKNLNALALIVGVADYKYTSDPALYADKDAEYFQDYAAIKLGVPNNNIFTITNTKADEVSIKKAVKNWLLRMSVEDKTDVYVFFAGHGLASSDGSNMFLLPYDGDPELLEDSAIDRKQLFADIQAISPRSVTVFLDSCYSGGTRAGGTLVANLRPIAIRAKEQNVPDGFTILSAAKGDQTSQSLEEAKHGLFSYFLMRGLEGDADANKDNQITAGELHNFVTDKVERQSGFKQTPDLQGDAERVLVRFE